jgi:diguanylate cyclase (GGDEF)-like protein
MGIDNPDYVPRILLMSKDLRLWSPRRQQLAEAGWRVLETADAREAFAAIKAEMIDLILLALPCQETSNMDLPTILRELAPLHHLPVVVLAEAPTEEQRVGFLDGGAGDVVCAATPPAEFVARIAAQLRVKELHEQLVAWRLALEDSLRRESRLLTRLRRDRAELRALCTTDPLTRAQNARSFQDILEHEFRVAARYDQPLSLLVLDVDHFKLVNDTFGHPTGDYVLKELTVILQQSVRDSDVVARTGGEEFCILLPQAGPKQAARFAQRIRKEVQSRRFATYGRQIQITVSIGWASYPADGEVTDKERLVYFADQTLLVAKETGRNRALGIQQLDPDVRSRLRRQHDEGLAAENDAAIALTAEIG